MPIKCGHCTGHHDTVADVRLCAKAKPRDDDMSKVSSPLRPKQVKFLRDLLSQFGLELEGDETPETISYLVGQPIISALVDARRFKATGKSFTLPAGTRLLPPGRSGKSGKQGTRGPTPPQMPEVKDGYYAIPDEFLGYTKNDLYFCRVVHKNGRIYVNQIVGGRPEYGMRLPQTIAWLKAILEFGIEDAGILFGREMQQCRRCALPLTKYASRGVLYGGTCADKVGLGREWRELDAIARKEGLDNEEDAA